MGNVVYVRKVPFRASREIHRGWNLKTNTMLSAAELDAMGFHILASGAQSHPEIILMALTPILDSFRKNVYEGDICSMGIELDGLGLIPAIGWCGWDTQTGGYTIFHNTDQQILHDARVRSAGDVRVIGDVFRNPDLLELKPAIPAVPTKL
jgi:hypothetical protein